MSASGQFNASCIAPDAPKDLTEAEEIIRILRSELADVAVAVGRSDEDGYDVDWFGLSDDVRELRSARSEIPLSKTGPLTLDNERQVFFYEQDNYPLSNFSSFRLHWAGIDFDTNEHAYHWYRFNGVANMHQAGILMCRSAHEAFRYAQENKAHQRPEWDQVKVGVMKEILHAKAAQHEYVRRKLLQTGDRELIENSHRDPYWGWGPNRDGKNMLGKLWMEVRAELRKEASNAQR
jgi:N-glycosidase YbiA